MLTLKENCKYDLIAPTSMGVRITPENYQPVHNSNHYYMQATSAETNVLNVSASLGLKTKALTSFVEGSPIALFIKSELKKRGIDFDGPEVAQGGPWGYRHQFNIADTGYGLRGPRVHNDRAGEIGRTLCADNYDLDKLFITEGVKMMHLSGLIAALSPETAEFCLTLARKAKQNGTKISFDLNYRASFWESREKELRAAFDEIASLSDVLVGNEEDFQLALGLEGPEAGGKGLSNKLESFNQMIEKAGKAYPKVSVFATTLREAINVNRHMWGAIMLSEGQWYEAAQREIGVLDRIGGGDAFVGGLLYSLLKGYTAEKQLQFGWACGALVVTELNDYASPADEDAVWSIWNANARIRR